MIAKNLGVDIFSLINYIKILQSFLYSTNVILLKAISGVKEGFQKVYALTPALRVHLRSLRAGRECVFVCVWGGGGGGVGCSRAKVIGMIKRGQTTKPKAIPRAFNETPENLWTKH